MVRLRGSTWALGLEEIFLGSVTAWDSGRVWAAVSATTVLMNMTIAKRVNGRIWAGDLGTGTRSLAKSEGVPWVSALRWRPTPLRALGRPEMDSAIFSCRSVK